VSFVQGKNVSGSFDLAPTDKAGCDFRAKGRLTYVGKHFGLLRLFLNELILPCPANGYRPPVQSHVLRRRG
jgi:hypothetical protein